MNWSDEHYVKLYTRDSLTWRSWRWEARTVFLHLVRKLDGSGFIETGRMDPVDALVLQLDLPHAVVEPGLAQLVADQTCEVGGSVVLLPNFVIAMLIPASRTEQRWWQDDVESHRDRGGGFTTHFLPGRTRFGHPGNPDGVGVGSPPFGCVLLVWRRR